MFDSVALNVVIGLVFIYLLYSLLATTINEALAATFSLRAKKLQLAITRMLDDGVMYHENIWWMLGDFFGRSWKNIKGFFSFLSTKKRKAPSTLMEHFYDHPGIKYLGENKISNKPSYISPAFFAKALTDVLIEKGQSAGGQSARLQLQAGIDALGAKSETAKFIRTLLNDSNNDIEKFKEALEQWFNETMSRTSGWYKKQSQRITFAIGLVLAILFNVDTISIVKELSADPKAANKMADMAAKYVETHKDSAGRLNEKEKQTVDELFHSAHMQVSQDINGANAIIGLGWSIPNDTSAGCSIIQKNALKTKADSVNCLECMKKIKSTSLFGWTPYLAEPVNGQKEATVNAAGKARYVICMAFSSARRILGYMLTALAISFGAPFWFDLLNKLIQIRGSGAKPEEDKKKNAGSKPVEVKRVG
jgi:hypothetical protein